MESIFTLINLLQSMSPLAIIALLGVIILLLVKNRREVDTKVTSLKENDLHSLPDILATLQRMEVSMGENFSWIKAKLNGHS